MKLSEIYEDGCFYVIGYNTGFAEEIELISKVFNKKEYAIIYAKTNCGTFLNKELMVFKVSVPTDEVFSTITKKFTLDVIYRATVEVEAKNIVQAVDEAMSVASKMPKESFEETWDFTKGTKNESDCPPF